MGCRDDTLGKAAAQKLCAEGFQSQPVLLDVTDGLSIQSAAAAIEAQFGRLDILVNNAGVALEPLTKPSLVELDLVRRVYDVNVFGVIAVTQAMLPLLLKSERGRIVTSPVLSARSRSQPGPVSAETPRSCPQFSAITHRRAR